MRVACEFADVLRPCVVGHVPDVVGKHRFVGQSVHLAVH